MGAPQERFSQGESLLHVMDPRAKVLGAACLSLAMAIINDVATACMGLGLGLLLLLLARLPWGAVLRRLMLVNLFTLLLWCMLPLTYGSADISLGPLALSRAGCMIALLITLKTNGILMLVLALLATSTVPALGRALRWWKVPEKLCLILVFSYRYLFVIHDEYMRLRRAATMRCFTPGTNAFTYRTFGNLLGMTLVRSHNRSQRVGQAMRLRGFQGVFHTLDARPGTGRDAVFGIACVLLSLLLLLQGR